MLTVRCNESSPVPRLEVTLTKVDVSVFNVIRRALYQDVRTLAADDVQIDKYDGDIEREMIAHRVGQLPLAPLDYTDVPAGAHAEFVISVATGARGVPSPVHVTSYDVKQVDSASGIRAEVVHYRSDAERAAACMDMGYKLCPLRHGQQLHMRFMARAGTGRQHARWQAVRVQCTRIDVDAEEFDMTITTTGAVRPDRAWIQTLEAVYNRLCVFC